MEKLSRNNKFYLLYYFYKYIMCLYILERVILTLGSDPIIG